MPIDLKRANRIGEEEEKDFSSPYGVFTVLNSNKVPFFGSSLLEKGFYKCPFCRDLSLKQIIEWRCQKCSSKVIYWKCYKKDEEEKHLFYDKFIENFEETTKRWAKAKKYSRKRDEKICGNEQEN